VTLRFIGKDPGSPVNDSPTIWVDEDDGSFVFQGWRITDDATLSQIAAKGPIPHHENCATTPGPHAPFLREYAQ